MIYDFSIIFFTGSPNAKIGLRMTTLHEEHYGTALEETNSSKYNSNKIFTKPQKLDLCNINSIYNVRRMLT